MTTRQMQNAPESSIFIWCNAFLGYPKSLARKIGREDLEVVSPEWLDSMKWEGRELTGIVVDHAAALSDRQIDLLLNAKARIRLISRA